MDAAQASGVLCGEASGMPELGGMQLHVSAMTVLFLGMQGLYACPTCAWDQARWRLITSCVVGSS